MRRVHPQAREAAEDAGRAEDPRGSVACDPRAVAAQALGSASRRVLLVDDNCDSIELLAEYLRRAGHEVVVAYDPSAALAAAGTQTFDAAVVDVGLPEMDGYELARRLREGRGHALRLFALTGYGDDATRSRSEAAGFEAHFTKPADPKAIAAILRS